MKKIIILFIGIALVSCNQEKKETAPNFDWLVGKWKRTNEEVGKETFANWEKKSNTEYTGSSYTTQNGDTIYMQIFRFAKSKKDWAFELRLKGESTSSSFKMTSYDKQEFTCENNGDYPNKEEDSPNKIKYWTKNNKLYATISGEKINLQFEYVPLKE